VAVRAIKFDSILGSILKGAKTPSAEISAEIAKLEQDHVVATEGLRDLIARADASILDGDDAALDRVERERQAFERTIQKARLAVPLLKEKLEAARDEERGVEWSGLRSAILEAGDNFAIAARQAHDAFLKLAVARERAFAAGFSYDVNGIPVAPALANVAEPGQPQMAMFAQAIEHYRATAPNAPRPLAPPQRDSTPFFHDGAAAARPAAPKELPIIPHGVGAGPVRLYVEPAGPGSRRPAPQAAPRPPQPAAATKISRPAPQPAPPPPPLVLPKADADGNISIVVMRRGAEIAGKGRRPGEQIKVPFADAEAAVRAGIADFTPGEAAK
jgi:hypothetical protein